jgi:putative methyltransferase (TIGR04325 family)
MNKKRTWLRAWYEPTYGELMMRRALGKEPEMEQFKLLINLIKRIKKPEIKVLDIGCGAGHLYRSLKKLDKSIIYVGVDISDLYIDMAKKCFSGEKNVSFIKGDITDLKLSDNSYDVVVCYQVLPYLPDYKKAVRELARVAKEHVFIRLYLGDYTHIIKVYRWGFKRGAPFQYYNVYSQDEFVNYLRKCGFREIKVYEEKFKTKIKKKKDIPFSTYTYGKLQIIGNIVQTWKVVHAIK